MPRTIFDKGDQVGVDLAIGSRTKLIESGTDDFDDIDIHILIPATDVVGLTYTS
jgi:hypothetical protein